MTQPDQTDPPPTSRMLSWVRNSAAYRLSKQMMTEKQLGDAIARKARQKFEGITDNQLKALSEAAIAFGKDMKALDDTAYAEIRTRSASRAGKSKKAISQKLVQKGVDRQIVQEAVAETDDLTAAIVFARKRAFGPFRRVELDEKQKAKELSAFARQGFSFEIGKRVLGMERDEAEELLVSLPW
ncbi:recombination regulator RecX [Rhizobium oryzicola]|uniref:Regulatory protein RecX n=1 Tax=Rhizobium oryzicola TaxID=1232668 RepID=A0ABT8SY86_9HYPH|nr:recombination regulator RecX [Rhizobium oryzicola]MDO1582936.1 recombination regulator RecX [Rhizobium oryzicola]